MLDGEKGLVLYCDASARPNPGKIGLGVHGYIFTKKELKNPLYIDSFMITNKGYFTKNKLEDSFAVAPDKYIDYTQAIPDIGTNNKGEVLALTHALSYINDADEFYKYVYIYTDSEYARKGLTEWCVIWEKNNWVRRDNTQISNIEEWKYIYKIYNDLLNKGCKLIVQWTESHCNDIGNHRADLLSVVGMNKATIDNKSWSYQEIADAKSYWKVNNEVHPLIAHKLVFFNSIENLNTLGQYFQAVPGVAELAIGKRSPETGFSIVRLKEPETLIELIKRKQFKISNGNNAIIKLKIDRLYEAEIYRFVKDFGEYSLFANRQNLNINYIDDKPITIELNPTNLSFRAIEAFNYLEEILDQYLNNNTDIKNSLNSHDITHLFYDTKEKVSKKETKYITTLKSDIHLGLKSFKFDIEEKYLDKKINIPVPFIFGIDIIPRNNLKKIENENPKIHLITWRESENTLRYATIINCDTGLGIWSNYFADRIFLSTFV